MEYLLVILITFNNLIMTRIPSLLYIFAACVLVWYIVGKRSELKSIGIFTAITVAYTVIVQLLTGTNDIFASGRFIVSILLNITLLVWVYHNIVKFDVGKLVYSAAILHLGLTVVAFITESNIFWKTDEYITGTKLHRLKLLYSEPAYLSFICGIFLVITAYEIIARKSSKKMVVAGVIFLVDMILSYGMGGMVTSIVAISVMLMAHIANSRNRILDDPLMKARWAVVASIMVVILAMIIILSPIYGLRFMNLAQGTDGGLSYVFQQPFTKFVNAMHMTKWRGVGIGQLVGTDIGRQLGVEYDFKNSYLKVMTEGGILGIILVVTVVIYLLGQCLLYGNVLSAALLIYSTLSQMTAGSFDDPVHWIVYGIILYECSKSKNAYKQKIIDASQGNNDNILNVPGYASIGNSSGNTGDTSGLKICLVGSSGGHLTHMYMLKPFWENKERFWVTFDKEDAKSLLKNERMIPCYYPTNRSIKGLIINTVLAFRVLRKERPDLIISTGAAVAVPFFYVGKIFGAKCIYIEVFDRIDKPTMSGKMVYPVADKFIVQWEEMKQVYPNAINLGSIF